MNKNKGEIEIESESESEGIDGDVVFYWSKEVVRRHDKLCQYFYA